METIPEYDIGAASFGGNSTVSVAACTTSCAPILLSCSSLSVPILWLDWFGFDLG